MPLNDSHKIILDYKGIYFIADYQQLSQIAIQKDYHLILFKAVISH